MSLQKSEIIRVIESYLKGALSKREASSWAVEVLTKEAFTLDQILLEDAVTALAGLHDEDERWDTAEEDLIFFKECLEGKRPYISKIAVQAGRWLKEKEEGGPLSWQEGFGRALDDLGERNKDIPLEQVEQDVDRAVKEVKANGFGEKVDQELNECLVKMKTDDVLGAAHKAKEEAHKLLSDKDNIAFFDRFAR